MARREVDALAEDGLSKAAGLVAGLAEDGFAAFHSVPSPSAVKDASIRRVERERWRGQSEGRFAEEHGMTATVCVPSRNGRPFEMCLNIAQ